jgi:hypothetical protein
MPSDSKKKRDLQKKAAAKQRQAQSGKKPNATGANNNPMDDDLIEEGDDGEDEIQNENENPINETNDIDPNVKSVIQNLDLLTMVEKANADARSCTGRKRNETIFFDKILFFFVV